MPISRGCEAIARTHRIAGYPLDTRHPATRETLRGIARTHGEPARRAAALTTAEVKRLIVTCDTELTGLRDRMLLLLGFAGALRRSELVGLDVEHVTATPAGLRLLIVRSKTDKAGKGQEIGIPRGGSPETCPVAALQDWLAAASIKSGPVFRKVNRWGAVEASRLHPDGVRQILRKRAALAGVKGSLLEAGLTARPAGGLCHHRLPEWRADEEIMGHTRHRSLTTMRSNVRRAKLGTSSPAGKLGL